MCEWTDIRVYWQYSSRTARVSDMVEVHQSTTFDKVRVWQKAVVHWSCTSSTTPERAREFGKCILLACELAEKWNEELAGKPFTPKEEEDHDQTV